MTTVIWIIREGAPQWQEEILTEEPRKITEKQINFEKLNKLLAAQGYKFSRLSYIDENEMPDFAKTLNVTTKTD